MCSLKDQTGSEQQTEIIWLSLYLTINVIFLYVAVLPPGLTNKLGLYSGSMNLEIP